MNIEKAQLINRNTLDESAYLESLITEAERKHLLTNPDIESVQDGLLQLLAHNLERLYGNYSDSVSEDRAKNMMDSIVYTIGVGLKAIASPDDAVIYLKQKGVDTIYMQGLKRIGEMIAAIKEMLAILQAALPENPNPEYLRTVTRTLPAILNKYNPETAAHDCIAYPQYPVSLPVERFTGIEYIFAYTAALLE